MLLVQLAGLIFLTPFIMGKLGKHRTFMVGTFITILGFLTALLAGSSFIGNCAANLLKGLGTFCTCSMIYALTADAIDYGEVKTGSNVPAWETRGLASATSWAAPQVHGSGGSF